MNISIHPKRVAAILGSIIATLAGLHVFVSILWLTWQHALFGIHRLFNLGTEASIPTYFSALQLLLAAILLSIISRNEYKKNNPDRWRWALLATGMLIMSVDEVSQIHDVLIADIVRPIVRDVEGFSVNTWYYAVFGQAPWLVVFLPLVGVLLAVFVPFLRRLPRRYLILFVSAGVIFVGGAIGVEMIEAYLISHEIRGYVLQANRVIEETCEMAGILIFIYALLNYISDQRIVLRLSVDPELHSRTVSEVGSPGTGRAP